VVRRSGKGRGGGGGGYREVLQLDGAARGRRSLHANCFRGLSGRSQHTTADRARRWTCGHFAAVSAVPDSRQGDGAPTSTAWLALRHITTATHKMHALLSQQYTYGHTKTLLSVHNKHLLTELTKCNSLLHRLPSLTALLALLLLYLRPALNLLLCAQLNLLLCAHSRHVTRFPPSLFLPHSPAALHAQFCTFCMPNVTLHKLHGLQMHDSCNKFGKNRSNVSNSKQEIHIAYTEQTDV